METKTGQLYDLGPDGLGFIAESESERMWAFQFPASCPGLAPDRKAFVAMEGQTVRFTVDDKERVVGIFGIEARVQAASVRATAR